MNWGPLQNKLLSAARKAPPSASVPYAFEKRVLARIKGLQPADEWAPVLRILTWAAVTCVTIAASLSLWTARPDPDLEAAHQFSSDLEQTILAAVDDESAW